MSKRSSRRGQVTHHGRVTSKAYRPFMPFSSRRELIHGHNIIEVAPKAVISGVSEITVEPTGGCDQVQNPILTTETSPEPTTEIIEEKLWETYPEWVTDDAKRFVDGILGVKETWERQYQKRKAASVGVNTESEDPENASALAENPSDWFPVWASRDDMLWVYERFGVDENWEKEYQKRKAARHEAETEIDKRIVEVDTESRFAPPEIDTSRPQVTDLMVRDEISMLTHQRDEWKTVSPVRKPRFERLRSIGKKVAGIALVAAISIGVISDNNNHDSSSPTTPDTTSMEVSSTIALSADLPAPFTTEAEAATPTPALGDVAITESTNPTNDTATVFAPPIQSSYWPDLLDLNLSDSVEMPELAVTNQAKDYTLLPWLFSHDTLGLRGDQLNQALLDTLATFNLLCNTDFALKDDMFVTSSGQVMNQEQIIEFNFISDATAPNNAPKCGSSD